MSLLANQLDLNEEILKIYQSLSMPYSIDDIPQVYHDLIEDYEYLSTEIELMVCAKKYGINFDIKRFSDVLLNYKEEIAGSETTHVSFLPRFFIFYSMLGIDVFRVYDEVSRLSRKPLPFEIFTLACKTMLYAGSLDVMTKNVCEISYICDNVRERISRFNNLLCRYYHERQGVDYKKLSLTEFRLGKESRTSDEDSDEIFMKFATDADKWENALNELVEFTQASADATPYAVTFIPFVSCAQSGRDIYKVIRSIYDMSSLVEWEYFSEVLPVVMAIYTCQPVDEFVRVINNDYNLRFDGDLTHLIKVYEEYLKENGK